MPFGLIFGALFFGILCGAFGLRWLVHPTLEGKIGGALLVILGITLALGLLMRRSWARWAGLLIGLMLAVIGLRLLADRDGVLDHVLPFAAIAAAILLAVPATGDPRRGAPPRVAAASSRIGPVGWTALASFLGLLVVGMSADTTGPAPVPARAGGLPASAIGRRIRWTDFGDGLTRAREENKPVLATFVTDWCPYCAKMARRTWRASSVVARLDEVVPVKIDAESSRASNGHTGRELAAHYGVSGYPVQMLLDADGGVIARVDGYQSPRQLLDWIDAVLTRRVAADPALALTGSSN
jgi:thiol-disulfide isomerase/thioredoxin